MRCTIHHLISNIDSPEVTGACLVAMLGQEMVGSLGLRLGGVGAFINSLYVREDVRNKGVATQLIAAAIDLSNGCGKNVIGLMVHNENEAARQLYRKLGFLPYDGEPKATHTEWIRVINFKHRDESVNPRLPLRGGEPQCSRRANDSVHPVGANPRSGAQTG